MKSKHSGRGLDPIIPAKPPTCSDPEWELVLLSVQPSQDPGDQQAILAQLQCPLDWHRCHRLAVAHGVSSLVHRRLSSLLEAAQIPEVWPRWSAECAAESHRNLARVVELRRVVNAFDERNIPVLVVKGPVLGCCLYGDIALRPFGDLDLVVPLEERERAIESLQRLGFVPQFELTASERVRFFRRYSELHLTSESTGTLVDLHWDLVSRRYGFARILDGYWDRATTAQIGPLRFKTLSAPDLFVYLLLHAAKHEWRCLGWLVDLAWLQQTRQTRRNQGSVEWNQLQWDDLGWDKLQRDAAELGIRRFISIGRQLGARLFGGRCDRKAVQSTNTDDPLVGEIIDGMTRDITVMTPLHSWPWQRIFYRALDRLTDRLRYAHDLVLAPTPLEWKKVPLPIGLTGLYPLIRIGRLLVKHAGTRRPD